jgi:hypothetical protein
MALRRLTGIYNFTNPGTVTHPQARHWVQGMVAAVLDMMTMNMMMMMVMMVMMVMMMVTMMVVTMIVDHHHHCDSK